MNELYYLIDLRKLFIWSRDLLVARLLDLGPRLADLRERDLLRLIDFLFSSEEVETRRYRILGVPLLEPLESDLFSVFIADGTSLRERRRVVDRLRPDRVGRSIDESVLPIRKGERRW